MYAVLAGIQTFTFFFFFFFLLSLSGCCVDLFIVGQLSHPSICTLGNFVTMS